LNPYSYIMNNPLAGTDPSGYCSKKTGSNVCQKATVSVGEDDKLVAAGYGQLYLDQGGDTLVKVEKVNGKAVQGNAAGANAGLKTAIAKNKGISDTGGQQQVTQKESGSGTGGQSTNEEKGGVEVEGSAGVRDRGPQKVRHKFVTQTGENMGWADPNDAVEAFYKANEALYQSAKKNKEILGWLIKGSDNKNYFTDAIKVRDEFKFVGSIIDADGNKLSSKISLRGPVKGVLHSHPGGNMGSQEAFSNKDWGIAEEGIDYYVRTPKGDMRYIDATISAGQIADSYGKKDGVSLCSTTPCLNPYGTK
jgi:hypothetical protein